MLVTSCLRNAWPTGNKLMRQIKTLFPQAYAIVEDSTQTLLNKASHKLFGPKAEEVRQTENRYYHMYLSIYQSLELRRIIVKDADLRDKYCLITGANSGIGLEMTRCLNARDCHVLMACRNTYAASIASRVCDNLDRLSISEVNLASLRSVKKFTERVVAEQKKFDIVILNAGVFGIPRTITEDGLETIFQVNYLSQIYLLMNIEDILAPDARVVFITSESHRYVNWPLEKRLQPTTDMLSLPESDYTSIKAFNVSKLCAVFAMHCLGYRWRNTGRGVFAASPGSFVKTKLCSNWWPYEMLYQLMQPFNKSIVGGWFQRQAAATPLFCATAPALRGLSALYFKDCARREESELALDPHLSSRVFDITQRLIHERVRSFQAPRLAASDTRHPHLDKEPIEDDLMSSYSG